MPVELQIVAMESKPSGNMIDKMAGKSLWLPFLYVIAASALAHLWCLGSQFYMDDSGVSESSALREGRFWDNTLTSWTCFGYVLQYKLFGMSAVAFHAVNWLLHTAVACVLFGFGRDFLRDRMAAGVALFAALLFAVHPLGSEIPNYMRTQDLAWVTLFSLLASWALLLFLRDGGWKKWIWVGLGVVGATLSKGPGIFHVFMMITAVGLAFMTPAHWKILRRGKWVFGAVVLSIFTVLWFSGIVTRLWRGTELWDEPRFIGHAYTVARVFWEFAWRAVIPVALSADHQIAETLVPPGSGWFNVPDKTAMFAAAAMLLLTAASLWLAWRKSTRLFGVCLFLFVATMLFRVLYLIPEFMPEYRIYPGLPWFCLAAAIALAGAWKFCLGGLSPRIPVIILLLVFVAMSARRSFAWHDLDILMADVLKQYPAQARAIWELQDRDAAAGEWQKVIDRQRKSWPVVYKQFMDENQRLSPRRELPSGHFALADIACRGQYALAMSHTAGSNVGLAEIQRMELYMRQLRLDPVAHAIHWRYFFRAKVRVLEHAGKFQAAYNLMEQQKFQNHSREDVERIKQKLKLGL